MFDTYKVVMYIQMLYRFCNIHTIDDGSRLGRMHLGTN